MFDIEVGYRLPVYFACSLLEHESSAYDFHVSTYDFHVSAYDNRQFHSTFLSSCILNE